MVNVLYYIILFDIITASYYEGNDGLRMWTSLLWTMLEHVPHQQDITRGD